MKVYISLDMEGVSGLVRWEDVAGNGPEYTRGCRILTADLNAAIAGACDAGADEVVVEENHGISELCNILMEEVDSRCQVVRGPGRPFATTMSALDAETLVVFLVGHHARAGSRPGIMAHTISYGQFRAVSLNGREVGEPDLFAIRAGELGVPLGLITGDQVVAEQVRALVPNVEVVIVKTALSNRAGSCIPPARSQEMIRKGAETAVRRAVAGEFAPYINDAAPYHIQVELKNYMGEGLRRNLETMPEFEIVNSRVVKTQADDMGMGFRRIAYLSFGDRPGLKRY